MDDNETLKRQAKSAITSNIVALISAISTSEEDIKTVIVACEQEKLITSVLKGNLLDGLTNQSADDRARKLVNSIQKTVSNVPTCLDTFLCVLVKGSIASKDVAAKIAAEYRRDKLPKYYGLTSGGQKQSLPSPSTSLTAGIPLEDSQLSTQDPEPAGTPLEDTQISSQDPKPVGRKQSFIKIIFLSGLVIVDWWIPSNNNTRLIKYIFKAASFIIISDLFVTYGYNIDLSSSIFQSLLDRFHN